MDNKPLFTIITLTYRHFDFIRQSLQAMMDQTYKNLEIIVVNNGATREITDYLNSLKDDRIKIIHYQDNQFSEDDPTLLFKTCFSEALHKATGEYVFYQSDDDLMSLDYVEKMVALFQGDPECTTAAGLPKRIDKDGNLLADVMHNGRPRYMPGHILALSTLDHHGKSLFSASGVIFTIKRDILVKAGGYYRDIERSHLFGIVPFGVTGFDETALFYFRQHSHQTSVEMNAKGYIGLHQTIDLLKDWEIEKHWRIFGKDVAKCVVRTILNDVYDAVSFWFAVNLYNCRFKAAFRILKDDGNSFYFWSRMPGILWTQKKQFWYYLKPKLRRVFEAHLWLVRLPLLAQLHKRVLK